MSAPHRRRARRGRSFGQYVAGLSLAAPTALPFTVEFVGGPLDGLIREYPLATSMIQVWGAPPARSPTSALAFDFGAPTASYYVRRPLKDGPVVPFDYRG